MSEGTSEPTIRIEFLCHPIVIDWDKIGFGLTVDGIEVHSFTELRRLMIPKKALK